MRDLRYAEFAAAWSTYWGRREIGIVLENPIALRIGASAKRLNSLYDQWREARSLYPTDTALWLLGTPQLTSELLTPPGVAPFTAPPPPAVGRYAVKTPGATGLSNAAGDYTTDIPRNSTAAQEARLMMRGRFGFALALTALFVVWLPFIAVPLAALSLVWIIPADRLLRRYAAPWRVRRRTVAGLVLAALAIVLSIVLVETTHSWTPVTTVIPRQDTT